MQRQDRGTEIYTETQQNVHMLTTSAILPYTFSKLFVRKTVFFILFKSNDKNTTLTVLVACTLSFCQKKLRLRNREQCPRRHKEANLDFLNQRIEWLGSLMVRDWNLWVQFSPVVLFSQLIDSHFYATSHSEVHKVTYCMMSPLWKVLDRPLELW